MAYDLSVLDQGCREMGIVLNISRVRYQSPQRAPAAERAPQAEVQLQGGNV